MQLDLKRLKRNFKARRTRDKIVYERSETVVFSNKNEVQQALNNLNEELRRLKWQQENLLEAIKNLEAEKAELEKVLKEGDTGWTQMT